MAELVLHYISEDGGDVDATMTELRNTSPAILGLAVRRRE